MPTLIVKWRRQWGGSDKIVWIIVAKVNASWKLDLSDYIGLGGTTHPAIGGRYDKVGKWVESGRPMHMPHLAFDDDGQMSFTDGRHRFAWMRDHGVKALPVTAERTQARLVARKFGSRCRTCRLPMPLRIVSS
jgi:hypothetical protein